MNPCVYGYPNSRFVKKLTLLFDVACDLDAFLMEKKISKLSKEFSLWTLKYC